MNRFVTGAAVLLLLAIASSAAGEQSASVGQPLLVEEARIRKHKLPLYAGLFGLGGVSGLNALAVLFAVKLKLLVVAALVGLSVYYYTRVYSPGYETIVPYSQAGPTYASPPIGYSSPSFIGAEHGSVVSAYPGAEYPSYPGPDPYSAYGPGSYSAGPPTSGSDGYGAYGGPSNDRSSTVTSYGSHSASSSSSSSDRRRNSSAKSKQQRQRRATSGLRRRTAAAAVKQAPAAMADPVELFNSINWAEIAFQFLGVDSMGCRRRFVCEFDFRAARNPLTRMAFRLIGRDFFAGYRDAGQQRAAHFGECAKLHRECAAAEAYDDDDDRDADEAQLNALAAVEADNEVIEYGDEANRDGQTDADAMLRRNARDVAGLIMLRADQ